jgi:hypothetical protein
MNCSYGEFRGPAPSRGNTVDAHSRDREDGMSIDPYPQERCRNDCTLSDTLSLEREGGGRSSPFGRERDSIPIPGSWLQPRR